jgi:hypothetical protein
MPDDINYEDDSYSTPWKTPPVAANPALAGYVAKPDISASQQNALNNVTIDGQTDAQRKEIADLNLAAQSYSDSYGANKTGAYTPTDLSSSSNTLSNIGSLLRNNAGLIAGGATLANMMGGNKVTSGGYQGTIPNVLATRMQVPGANDPYRVPGSSGRQYFTDTLYTDPSQQGNAEELIRAQAQAIAANQPNAPVPSFAMPWNKQPGGITSLPATQTQAPAVNTANLASQLQTAYNAGNIGSVNNILSSNNLDMTALQKLFPNLDTAGMKTLTDAGVKLPPGVNQPPVVNQPAATNTTTPTPKSSTDITKLIQQIQASTPTNTNAAIAKMMDTNGITAAQMAAATGFTTGEIQNLYNQAKGITGTTAVTDPAVLKQQLLNTASGLNAGDKGGIAGLNNLIQANGLNATQLQSMFPGIDLGAYATQGVNIPGYTAPATGVASLPAAGYDISSPFAQAVLNSDKITGNTISPEFAYAMNYTPATSSAATTPVTPVSTTPAAPAANPIASTIQSMQASGADNTSIASALMSQGYTPAQVIAVTGADSAPIVQQAFEQAYSMNYDNPGGAKAGGLMGYARGGIAGMGQAQYLQGSTDGMADKLPTSIDGVRPAKLSHGEFVVPADVVSHLGNGNSDAGAKKLYQMMDRIRMDRTGTKKQGKEINPDKYMPGGIVGYAGGGAVAFEAGGSTSTNLNLGANAAGVPGLGASQSNTLSPWAGDYVTSMLGKAQALTNGPMPVYQGPLSAGQSALQNQQFAGLSEMAQTGYDPATFTSGTFNSKQADQYMNPYLSASLAPQLSELQRQAQINNTMDASKLTGAGAYGGGRQAVLMGEQNRNLLDKSNALIGSGYNTAYNNAMTQFNSDQARQMQAQQGTEASRQFSANTGIQTLKDLGQAGATQRDIAQQGIAADLGQYKEQQAYPYQQLQFQQSMLQGLPISTSVATANTTPMSTLAGNVAGYTGLSQSLANLGLK